MSYNKYPVGKIKRILNWLKKHSKSYTVDEVKHILEQKFTVGVFVHYGRLQGQVHTLEIWTRMREHWQQILLTVEVPVEQFKPTIDA